MQIRKNKNKRINIKRICRSSQLDRMLYIERMHNILVLFCRVSSVKVSLERHDAIYVFRMCAKSLTVHDSRIRNSKAEYEANELFKWANEQKWADLTAITDKFVPKSHTRFNVENEMPSHPSMSGTMSVITQILPKLHHRCLTHL